jgi:thioredoxin-like negative regulator of GroEL
VTQDTVQHLLALSRSPSWEQRCRAAIALAGFQTGEAAAAMRALLHDQENTAPILEAARALLRRGDSYGANLIFHAIATADDDTAEHLLYFVGLDVQQRTSEMSRFRTLAEASLAADDAHVRQGAAEVMEDLGWKPRSRGHEDSD